MLVLDRTRKFRKEGHGKEAGGKHADGKAEWSPSFLGSGVPLAMADMIAFASVQLFLHKE
jgi:hypothetical protein